MLPSGNGLSNLDLGQREVKKYQQLANQEGAEQIVPPHFRLRGQPGPQGTATFPAASASGATETVSLALPVNIDLPEWAQIIFVNHADAAVAAVVTQTVSDFVVGSGNVDVAITTSIAVPASGGTNQVLVQYPFTTDGPLTVTFTASASMTNGGKVGAQLRFQG